MTTEVTGGDPSHDDTRAHAMAVPRSPTQPVGLATLQPLRVVPAEFSPRTRVVLALRRIEFVRILLSPKDGVVSQFQVHVFDKSPQHHIPLSEYSNGRSLTTHPHWMKLDGTSHREPDAVVDRSLTDLCKLHDELFQLARIGHKLEPCPFCVGIIEYCGYSRVKPQRSMTWLHSSESVCEKLSAYLNELLQLVSKVKAFHADNCVGQESIPLVLHRFLQVAAGPRRMSEPLPP